ncbi:MAG TPA: hypothetical protein VFO67_00650 [Gemmatimonadales bacterium]|nr:hypothetical protein [Gemmatimonadales bacterium]
MWIVSVIVCLTSMAGSSLIATAWTGRWEHAVHNISDVTTAFTAVFAALAFVFIPLFMVLERVVGSSSVTTGVVVGVLLGAVGCLATAVVFAESEDPQTAWGWIQYWAARPLGFALGAAPFMVAGAVFGFVWIKRRP